MKVSEHLQRPVLRRPKHDPCRDLKHTLAIGLPIAALLFLILPALFG